MKLNSSSDGSSAMRKKTERSSLTVLALFLVVSILPHDAVFGQGKGKRNTASEAGRLSAELPSGLKQPGDALPKGLQNALEKKQSLPSGLETGGKKAKHTGKKAVKKAKKSKVNSKGKDTAETSLSRSRMEGQFPSGVAQHIEKQGDSFPKGLQDSPNRKGSLPTGLETQGKKTKP